MMIYITLILIALYYLASRKDNEKITTQIPPPPPFIHTSPSSPSSPSSPYIPLSIILNHIQPPYPLTSPSYPRYAVMIAQFSLLNKCTNRNIKISTTVNHPYYPMNYHQNIDYRSIALRQDISSSRAEIPENPINFKHNIFIKHRPIEYLNNPNDLKIVNLINRISLYSKWKNNPERLLESVKIDQGSMDIVIPIPILEYNEPNPAPITLSKTLSVITYSINKPNSPLKTWELLITISVTYE